MKFSLSVIMRMTGLSVALMAFECRADDTLVFTGIVKPILVNSCTSCHGDKKQKKKLRLDSLEAIMKGGKDGAVVVPGTASNSDLLERIRLDLNDDDHMPPKGKHQLSDQEIMILEWWINAGAPGDVPLSSLKVPDAIEVAIHRH